MSEAISIELLVHQVKFVQSQKRFVALVGGFGSGKSYACGAKAYMLANINHGFEGAIISRSSKQLRDFLIPEVEKFLRSVQCQYAFKDGNKIVIDWGADKSVIHLLTTENDAYQRWAGGNWAWAVIDEIDTHTKPFETWSFVNDRIRVRAPLLQTACASTPEGFGFLYTFFEKEPSENSLLCKDRELIRGVTFDNPHLDIDYVRGQIQTRNALSLRAYIYGEFINLQGTPVYWKFDRELNVTTKTLADFPNHVLHLGIDFNKGINATTVGVIKDNHLHFVDEIYGSQDTQVLANDIKRRYPWHASNNAIRFYPDASGFEGIQTLKRNFPEFGNDGQPNFRFAAGNPRVERRVAAFNEKFKPVGRGPECFVNMHRCPELYKGLTQQVYDKHGAPDKTSGIDHALDGAGYLVYKIWPLTGTVSARIT